MSIDETVQAAIKAARRQGARRAIFAMLAAGALAFVGKNAKPIFETIARFFQ